MSPGVGDASGVITPGPAPAGEVPEPQLSPHVAGQLPVRPQPKQARGTLQLAQ
jgi:hypothetical protein